MSTIFISHSSEDNAWAERIRDWLQGSANKQQPVYRYQSLFLDFDPEVGIPVGCSWRETLYEKLQLCRAVIVICSAAYGRSQWCLAELGVAMASGKLVLPVRIDDSPPLRLLIETQRTPLVPFDLNRNGLEGWQDLERGLQALSWRERLAWPPDNELDAAPFPGLSCFERKHAPVFFGQDQTLRQAQAKVEALAASASRLLLILGASGCGKSSLLRAGLVPWLAGVEAGRWIVLPPFRPGRKPFLWLGDALVKAFQAVGQPAPGEPALTARAILEQLEELRCHSGQQDAKVVIAIDQFEELLGRGDASADAKPTEADDFLSRLADLLKLEGSRVLVLATLRSDCLGSLQLHPSRLESLAGDPILLGPMDVDGFRQVIEGPAQRVGLRLETGLSDRLVRDTPSGDALPLLAFTLRELWDGRADDAGLTLQQYATFGGLAGAVQRKADEVLSTSGATEEEFAALERAFIDHLVRLTSDGQAAKQPARLGTLPAASRRLVGMFVEARLLVSGKGRDRDAVEIAHEALLRTWPTLVTWIDKGREALLQRLRVRRLGEDLSAQAPERQRRQALEQLAALAVSAGDEARAVEREGAKPLGDLLSAAEAPEADRQEAALVLALIGAEQPLRDGLGDMAAPVAVRRRAAESLGLLAMRCGDPLQRQAIERELEGWMRQELLDLRLEVDEALSGLDPNVVNGLVASTASELAEGFDAAIQTAMEAGQLPADFSQEQRQELFQQLVVETVMGTLRQALWRDGLAAAWEEHDRRLPLIQGASRGVQLAASADLPLLGSGLIRRVPMLTLTALREGEGLRIRTEVVTPPVWKLPLPEWPGLEPQQLELVVVPADDYTIGSPEEEDGRDVYTQFRQKCEGVNVEAQRRVSLKAFALVRHPISQAQWRAVAALPQLERDLSLSPGTYDAKGLWETHAQPGGLAVDSVSWNDCQEWLKRLNGWLQEKWLALGGEGEPPVFALPSESQWEAACRAGSGTPFHFGDTLDVSWANVDGNYTYGADRKGIYRQRPVPLGAFGLVNRWGLAEMHGQLQEWCADQWHRHPIPDAQHQQRGWLGQGGKREQGVLDGRAIEGPDAVLEGNQEQAMRLLRGGSWFGGPVNARAAMRGSLRPDDLGPDVGVRPGCFSPPAPFTVRAVGRDSNGSARRVTDPRVQTRSGDRRQPQARPAPNLRPHEWNG
jgi:formylglycine-generating enzyme required for sulfatase activity